MDLARQPFLKKNDELNNNYKTNIEIMKKIMKNLITAAIVIGGAIMASPSAFAQVSLISDDLYMGFENQAGGGTADYIINFGARIRNCRQFLRGQSQQRLLPK